MRDIRVMRIKQAIGRIPLHRWEKILEKGVRQQTVFDLLVLIEDVEVHRIANLENQLDMARETQKEIAEIINNL